MSSATLKKYKSDRLREYAQKHNVDLLIASLHENIRYMTDFICVGGAILHRTQTYSLLDVRSGKAALVIGYGEAAAANERLGEYAYYCYGAFRYDCIAEPEANSARIRDLEKECFKSAESALEQAIMDCSLKSGRIGMDESLVSIPFWKHLEKTFPQYEFVPAAAIFYNARKVKHSEEILCLERAAAIAEQAMFSAIKKLRVGITEKEIEACFVDSVYALGGTPFFCVASADLRSANVDAVNTDLKITANSHIRFDLGCDYNGYKSDISRTVAIGKYDRKVKEAYHWVREGESAAVAAMRPGVLCEEIFYTAVKTVNKGLPSFRRHHCGHGIGLEIYDFPSIAPGVKDELEENMVLCIETPYYILGWGGVQVEDTFQVTHDGTYSLTKTSNDLVEIEI